jgi:carotenoid cleavage dioxygenase
MTAHVRIDPETGEMFFFGYEAGGLCSRDVAYGIADKDGKLTSEQWFEAPYCGLMHDFAITAAHAVFPVFPTTADLDRLKAGGDHWAHQADLDSWIGVMPRYGKVEEMRWFKGPKGVFSFHILNAWAEGDAVHLDLCLSGTNPFPFIRAASGIHVMPWEIKGGLVRWTMDLARNSDAIDERPIGPPGDLPRIAEADQGRPYRRGWYLTMNPQMQGPPLVGGPVESMMNLLLRVDPETGPTGALAMPPGMAIHEPTHVPSKAEGHGGWLLSTVDRQAGSSFESELWVIEADKIEAGPVAKVKVPVRLRSQVHGWWVPAEQLAQAKART